MCGRDDDPTQHDEPADHLIVDHPSLDRLLTFRVGARVMSMFADGSIEIRDVGPAMGKPEISVYQYRGQNVVIVGKSR